LARGSTPLIVALISVMFLGVYLQPTELAAMTMIGLGVIAIALVGKTTVCSRTAAVLAHRTGSLIAAIPPWDGRLRPRILQIGRVTGVAEIRLRQALDVDKKSCEQGGVSVGERRRNVRS
tara:strand:- start:833 stop:1192 length:360 start_codon:yes stop_codon:yes gene_type:complete